MYESKKKYFYGTGRRKSSVARVRVYENGTGSIIINGREIDNYFGLETLKLVVNQPLVTTDLVGKVAPAGETLTVVIPPEQLEKVPENRQEALRGVLAQDPRPHYQNDPERVYGFQFAGLEVRFSVAEQILTVREIIPQ